MFDPARLFTVASVSLCLCLVGCNTESNDPVPPASDTDHSDHDHADHASHDHDQVGHEQDHAGHDQADQSGPGHDEHPAAGPLPSSNANPNPHAGEHHALGTFTIAGGTFTVAMTGNIAPITELHFDIVQTAGPTIDTLRLWIGDESATGSLKSKTTAHDNHFHAHVETPVTLSMDTALWIEADSTSGDRQRTSVSLK